VVSDQSGGGATAIVVMRVVVLCVHVASCCSGKDVGGTGTAASRYHHGGVNGRWEKVSPI